MAEVTVFVDDAVRGRLPAVCAKDGVAADGTVRFTEEVNRSGRLGLLWLLVLAGPAGWLALLILAFVAGGRGEELTVRLPYTDAAFARYGTAVQARMAAGAVGIAGALAVIVLLIGGAVTPFVVAAFLLALAGALAIVPAEAAVRRSSVAISLDASRRWVTLGRVHENFAAACRAAAESDVETRAEDQPR